MPRRHRPLRLCLLLVVVLALTGPISAQLTQAERKGLRDALYVANLTEADLKYERRPFPPDVYRLSIVNLAIESPLEAADALMAIHASANSSISRLLHTARKDLLGDQDPAIRAERESTIELPLEVPAELRSPMAALIASVRRANVLLKMALYGLTPDEKRTLIEGLPLLAWPEAKLEFVKHPAPPRNVLFALLSKVDLVGIRIAAELLAADIDNALPALRQAARQTQFTGHLRFTVDGMPVVLGGLGNDDYSDRDALLTVDLGGSDRYSGRHGAGPGYASVLIDLSGDDQYTEGDLSVGAGLLGIGMAYDLGGNDTFRCGSISLGAGMGGVGVFFKEGGSEFYDSALMTQGFGHFGIGLCIDAGGNDHYFAKLLAQGAALTQGVGWIIDREGDDTYRAGGEFLNSPLFADVHYSMAQGYASGIREDTGGVSGGVGLLTDLKGDDKYIGETYCQAASYWFALASLYDAQGNDTYAAYHYAQASAMHLCGAYLFDLAGDDIYGVSFGAAHAIGHDFGAALLLDRAGDDVYAARDSRPGIGNANGIGIFLETAGEDRYFGPPGSANPARGTGSLGIFVDMDGPDKYAEGLADASVRIADNWGVAYDAETAPRRAQGNASSLPAPKPGSRPIGTNEELEKLYARATQWSVGTAADDTQKAIDALIEMGMPALKWMIEKKLAAASRLEQRAFVEVAQGIGSEGKSAVAAQVLSKDDTLAKNALNVCVDGSFAECEPHLPQALARPALARLAARLAGQLKSQKSVDTLMLLSASQDRLAAVYAMGALAEIADPKSVGTGQAYLTAEHLPLRKAAIALVSKFPDQALASGRLLIEGSDERAARIGIELLGEAITHSPTHALVPSITKEIARYLSDPRAGVKIQAMLALDGRCPPESRQILLDLRRDPNPLVRAVAKNMDPGR